LESVSTIFAWGTGCTGATRSSNRARLASSTVQTGTAARACGTNEATWANRPVVAILPILARAPGLASATAKTGLTPLSGFTVLAISSVLAVFAVPARSAVLAGRTWCQFDSTNFAINP